MSPELPQSRSASPAPPVGPSPVDALDTAVAYAMATVQLARSNVHNRRPPRRWPQWWRTRRQIARRRKLSRRVLVALISRRIEDPDRVARHTPTTAESEPADG